MKRRNQNSFTAKTWSLAPADEREISQLKARLNISHPLARLLVQRGLRQPKEARDFLHPSLQSLPSPFLLKGMPEAVELIHQALQEKKPIVIFGDYDADGVTATAVLARFFREGLGVDCYPCHPNRFHNGYGIKAELVEAASPGGAGLVISVDCGISDNVEVSRLKAKGWLVIVTDHHQPPARLPEAHAIINPWQEGCGFSDKDLAGVGVAFYLAMGLRTHLNGLGRWPDGPPPNLKQLLDLVAVGTISDMVPLLGVNRILAKAGLEVLGNSANRGLAELLDLCNANGSRGGPPNHDTIAFHLGPRLNAAGRMGDARLASDLLTTNERVIARQLAERIEHENQTRRELSDRLLKEAIELVEAQGEAGRQSPCLIVYGRDWHLGLLGIISSRLVDLYGKPSLAFAGQGTLKGSARSVPGINIHEVILACAAQVLEFGGHSSAAGLSLKEENLPAFINLAQAEVWAQAQGRPLYPDLLVDYVITDDCDFADIESACLLLRPFGQANPEPVFTTDHPCRLRNVQVIGKERNHLRFSMQLAGRWIEGIGFGFGPLEAKASHGELTLPLAFSLKENHFNGQVKPQVVLHDILQTKQEITY